jgi:hypothetical protein
MAKGGKRTGSGRKRKPVELRVLEGTFQQKRHGAAARVDGAFPPAPAHLSDAERLLWESFPKPGWIGETDGMAVNAAVSTFALILRNQRAMRETDESDNPLAFKTVITEKDGQERMTVEAKENPLYTQQMKLWARLMSVLATLGLTPADRAKMTAPKVDADAEDKWAGIL